MLLNCSIYINGNGTERKLQITVWTILMNIESFYCNHWNFSDWVTIWVGNFQINQHFYVDSFNLTMKKRLNIIFIKFPNLLSLYIELKQTVLKNRELINLLFWKHVKLLKTSARMKHKIIHCIIYSKSFNKNRFYFHFFCNIFRSIVLRSHELKSD